MKKISIIIPNNNCSKFIKKTFDSITEQTFKNYEVIFIDDGSSDDSLKIVSQYKEILKDKLILISQYNQNGAVARNRGLEIANGDYVLFLDSDDELYNGDTLKNMIENIDGYDLLLGNHIIIDENNNIIKEYNKDGFLLDFDNQYKYIDISPVPTSKLYSMKIIRNNKLYFSNVKIGQDLNFYLKYLLHVNKIYDYAGFIYKYRIVANSVTRIKNTNFIDIYNSMNEVRKHYLNNNFGEKFYKYVAPTCVGHISGQMEKVRNFKNRKIKKMIYSYFTFAIDDFVQNNKYKTKRFNKKVLKFKIKKILLKLGAYKTK